ncbi:MAG: chorismate mutase [Vicinamibacterales bacterium]
MTGDLDDLRHRIDLLDESLVKLLNARAACALEIGRLKREMGIAIYQPARETEVLRNVERVNIGPLDHPAVKRLFERIIDEARHLERIAEEVSHTPVSEARSESPHRDGPGAPRGEEQHAGPPGVELKKEEQ